MWSDRMGAASRSAMVERLRGVLPAARANRAAAGWRGDAAALQNRTGFVWLDQPRPRIFVEPLVRMELCTGRARVEGPEGTIEFEARGFDLMEAALEAWGGAGNAVLAGYLGYELGMELEDLATPRRRAGDLPDLWLGLYDGWLECEVEGRDD